MPTGIGTLAWNGVNLQTLAFYHERIPGFKEGPSRMPGWLGLPGSTGGLWLEPVSTGPRHLQVSGVLMTAAGTQAALVAAEKALLDWLDAGPGRLTFDDGVGYQVVADGVLWGPVKFSPRGDGPAMNAQVADVAFEVRCRSGYWRMLEPTIINLAVAGTRYPIRLRTGPVTPILIGRGAGSVTNPTFTYRTPDGTARRSLAFTGLNLGSDDRVVVSMVDRMAYKYTAGSRTSAMNNWSGHFPWAFSPRDANPGLGITPTIEISEGTGRVIYFETDQ